MTKSVKLLQITSILFAGLGFLQIPVMLLIDNTGNDYWADLWNAARHQRRSRRGSRGPGS